MSNRPIVSGWVKSKDTGNCLNLFAMWSSEYGINGRFERDTVRAFNMKTKSGEVVKVMPDTVWLNGKMDLSKDEYPRMWVKSRDTGSTMNIFSFSKGDYGLLGKFSENVVSIEMELDNGQEVTIEPGQVYLNGKFDEEQIRGCCPEAIEEPVEATAVEVDSPSTDNIPF